MRVLLADDQMDVRSGLKILLEHESGLNAIEEAASVGELLQKIQNTKPDMVLLDWELSDLRIENLIPAMRLIHPGLNIIALSTRPEARKAAMDAGVDAFVSKGDQPEKLLETINRLL